MTKVFFCSGITTKAAWSHHPPYPCALASRRFFCAIGGGNHVPRGGRPQIELAVIDPALSDLFILRGGPAHIRSDKGPEFVAQAVQEWIRVSVPTPLTLSEAALGRTATSRASTHAFAMSCQTGRSSTRCGKLSSSGA